MSIDSLLNQSITLYSKASYDGYGRATFGSGVNQIARIQPKQKRVLVEKGDVVTIEAIAYLRKNVIIAEDDKVTYDGKDYRVFAVYKTPDGKGKTSFIRVELVKWQT